MTWNFKDLPILEDKPLNFNELGVALCWEVHYNESILSSYYSSRNSYYQAIRKAWQPEEEDNLKKNWGLKFL